MSDEDVEQCPGEGECDDPYCAATETFVVQITHTVTFAVRAHSEDEAQAIVESETAGSFGVVHVRSAHIDNVDDDCELTVDSERESLARAAARTRAQRLRADVALAEEEVTNAEECRG